MRVGSLFAGIGGFDLAARWVGWSTAWYSEIEPHACRVMAKHFPEAENLGDITKIIQPPPVDLLCGGFPCQDISLAGRGAGITGERSGLWKHYARLIGEIRPRWVVAENVSALRSRGLDVVLQDLDALGYDAEWHCIPAAYVGAPHRRDRIWIVAYPHRDTREGRDLSGPLLSGWGSTEAERQDVRRAREPRPTDAGPGGAVVDDAERPRLEGHAGDGGDTGRQAATGSAPATGLPCGADVARWWASEPNVGRVAHGVPARVDRLRCLGNAVVPQVPYLIFSATAAHEARHAAGLSHI